MVVLILMSVYAVAVQTLMSVYAVPCLWQLLSLYEVYIYICSELTYHLNFLNVKYPLQKQIKGKYKLTLQLVLQKLLGHTQL